MVLCRVIRQALVPLPSWQFGRAAVYLRLRGWGAGRVISEFPRPTGAEVQSGEGEWGWLLAGGGRRGHPLRAVPHQPTAAHLCGLLDAGFPRTQAEDPRTVCCVRSAKNSSTVQ